MTASYNSQQVHVIGNCVPVGNASFCNVFNLCKFQHTISTDKVHDTLLLPLFDDFNLTNIEKKKNSDVVDNSIDLIISVSTNNVLTSSCNNANDYMLMTINEVLVSRNTHVLTSCHETVIRHSTYCNSVIANTSSANINTSSDNVLTSVSPTKLADYMHMTSNKEEVFIQTHTLKSFDKSHAFNETSRANLQSGFLHKFMECVQLRRNDFASAINLCDYPLTVPKIRVSSRGLMLAPMPHSVNRLSLRESISK